MSSELPSSQRVADIAAELGDQVRRTYDRVAGADDVGGALGAADLAVELGGKVLGATIAIGEQVLEGARELESWLGERRGAGGAGAPRADPGAPAVALDLPAASPRARTSGRFTVRNDSRTTIDAMPLRCDGLFGADGARVSGRKVSFLPSPVAVGPGATAEVECVVRVPKSAKSGSYTGLIEAAGFPGARLLVTLEVI